MHGEVPHERETFHIGLYIWVKGGEPELGVMPEPHCRGQSFHEAVISIVRVVQDLLGDQHILLLGLSEAQLLIRSVC